METEDAADDAGALNPTFERPPLNAMGRPATSGNTPGTEPLGTAPHASLRQPADNSSGEKPEETGEEASSLRSSAMGLRYVNSALKRAREDDGEGKFESPLRKRLKHGSGTVMKECEKYHKRLRRPIMFEVHIGKGEDDSSKDAGGTMERAIVIAH